MRYTIRMNAIVDALRSELASLEAELRSDPRYVKAGKVRELISLYSGSEPKPAQSLERKPVASPGTRENTKRYQVKSLVWKTLAEQGRPVHRTLLLDRLKAAGLMGSEKDPMASLAAYLSEWREEFQADGRGNFTLASAKTNEAADQRSTAPSSQPVSPFAAGGQADPSEPGQGVGHEKMS